MTRENSIAGPLNVGRGALRIGPGGSLSATTLTVAGNVSSLNVAGGTFVASGLATMTPGNSSIVIDSGMARFDGGVTCTNTRDAIFRVRGGVVAASSVFFPRTSDATINFGTGLLIQGGTTTIGSVSLGTVNSWGVMSVEAGSLAITGPLTVGHQVTSGRGGAFRVTGGELRVNDAEFGVVMSRNPGTNPNNVSQANFLGGVSVIEKFTLGFDSNIHSRIGHYHSQRRIALPGRGRHRQEWRRWIRDQSQLRQWTVGSEGRLGNQLADQAACQRRHCDQGR